MELPDTHRAKTPRVPGGPEGKLLLTVQAIDKIGTGLFVTVVVILLSDQGRSPAEIGLVLGVAGVGGIAGGPLLGAVGDRRAPRGLLQLLHLIRAAAFAAYPFITDSGPLLLALSIVIGFCDRAAVTNWQQLAAAASGSDRTRFQGWSRTVANAFYGVGALLGSVSLLGGLHVVQAAVVVNAVTFLACAALLARLPRHLAAAVATPGSTSSTRLLWALLVPLKDPRYRLFLAGEALLLTGNSTLKVGIPLWIVTRTSAPPAVTGIVMATNTALVVLLQVRVSERMPDTAAAARALPIAGAALPLAGVLLAASAGLESAAAAVLVVSAAIALTIAELVQSVTAWELSLALAPELSRGSFLGTYQGVRGSEEAVGPLLLAAVIATGPAAVAAMLSAAGTGALLERLALARLNEHRRKRP